MYKDQTNGNRHRLHCTCESSESEGSITARSAIFKDQLEIYDAPALCQRIV